MRLIDADALKEDIDNLNLFKSWIREEIKAHIDNVPTIEERPQGKWVNVRDFNKANCSLCESTGHASYNFCPICGARMTNYPKPTEPIPIYGGKVEPIKVYVNGKEVPFEGNLAPIMRGTFDNDTGIVKLRHN